MSGPNCKKPKTLSTGEFILILLFIYLAVIIGMWVKMSYF